MKKAVFWLFALMIAFAAVYASADMKVVNEQTTKKGDEETSGEQISYYKGEMARMDDPSGTITIIRLDKEVIWTIMTADKKYQEMSLETLAKQMEAMKDFFKIEKDVKKTDEKKTIDGYKCQKVITEMSMMGTKMVFTSWVTKDIKIDESMLKFAEKAEEAFEDIPMLKIAFGMVKDFTDEGYFPVLMEQKVEAFGQSQESTNKLKSVSYDKLDADLFEIPEGFEKAKSAGSMGM